LKNVPAAPTVRIVSIGALAAHPLWGERAPARTGHATTTLIVAGDARILVDPGLPERAIVARLAERANLAPGAITHVFFTTFKPDTTRGVEVFSGAEWLVHADEREGVGVPLITSLKEASSRGERELAAALERDVAVLQRCKAAPDKVADGVDLFPLPGVTPGACGLLVADPRWTTLVCGDAIPTIEHLLEGKVLPTCADVERARESFTEAVEIADLLVLGRDNITLNPIRGPF